MLFLRPDKATLSPSINRAASPPRATHRLAYLLAQLLVLATTMGACAPAGRTVVATPASKQPSNKPPALPAEPTCEASRSLTRAQLRQTTQRLLIAEGQTEAEVGSVWVIERAPSLVQVRHTPGAPWELRQVEATLHHNPAEPTRYALAPADDAARRLMAVVSQLASEAPAGLELVGVYAGLNRPKRVVVAPHYADKRGRWHNDFTAPLVRFDPRDGSWVMTRRTEAMTRALAEQRALADHLNARELLLIDQGAAIRDPRGQLKQLTARDCAAGAPAKQLLVLLTNPGAKATDWQLSPEPLSPQEHEARTDKARQAALDAYFAKQQGNVLYHQAHDRRLVLKHPDGSEQALRYQLVPEGDAPLEPSGWRVAAVEDREALLVYQALSRHFTGRRVCSFAPTNKGGALIRLGHAPLDASTEPTTADAPWFARQLLLRARVQAPDGAWQGLQLTLSRAAGSPPMAVGSWRIAETRVLASGAQPSSGMTCGT